MSAEQKSWKIFEEGDLSLCQFPPNWNCLFDQNGDGVKMMIPITKRKYLGCSPKDFERQAGTQSIVEAPRSYIEKVWICFVKNACGLK